MSSVIFKLGDVVEFGGMIGEVVDVDRNPHFPILCKFNSGTETFTADGKLLKYHTKPLLNFVSRQKTKRVVKLHKALSRNPADFVRFYVSDAFFENESDARKFFGPTFIKLLTAPANTIEVELDEDES